MEAKEHQATHAESEFRIISDDQLSKAHDPSAGKIHHDRSLVRKKKKKKKKANKERKSEMVKKKELSAAGFHLSQRKEREME